MLSGMCRTHCPVTLEILRSGGMLTEVAEEVLSAPQYHSFSIVAHSESEVSDKCCCGSSPSESGVSSR